jgi:hypothetical protein
MHDAFAAVPYAKGGVFICILGWNFNAPLQKISWNYAPHNCKISAA